MEKTLRIQYVTTEGINSRHEVTVIGLVVHPATDDTLTPTLRKRHQTEGDVKGRYDTHCIFQNSVMLPNWPHFFF